MLMKYTEKTIASNHREYLLFLWRKIIYTLIISVQLVSHWLTPFLWFAVVYELAETHSFFQPCFLIIKDQNLSVMDRACNIAKTSLHTFISETPQLLTKYSFLIWQNWINHSECLSLNTIDIVLKSERW